MQPARFEVTAVSCRERGAMNPSNAGNDCVGDRDGSASKFTRCNEFTVTIRSLGIEMAAALWSPE